MFSMGYIILRTFVMIPFEMFFRYHLRNTRRIVLLDSGRSTVDDLEDAL